MNPQNLEEIFWKKLLDCFEPKDNISIQLGKFSLFTFEAPGDKEVFIKEIDGQKHYSLTRPGHQFPLFERITDSIGYNKLSTSKIKARIDTILKTHIPSIKEIILTILLTEKVLNGTVRFCGKIEFEDMTQDQLRFIQEYLLELKYAKPTMIKRVFSFLKKF